MITAGNMTNQGDNSANLFFRPPSPEQRNRFDPATDAYRALEGFLQGRAGEADGRPWGQGA
jgi:hypothetical protein